MNTNTSDCTSQIRLFERSSLRELEGGMNEWILFKGKTIKIKSSNVSVSISNRGHVRTYVGMIRYIDKPKE